MKNSIKTRHKNRPNQPHSRNRPLIMVPPTTITGTTTTNQTVHINTKPLVSDNDTSPVRTWKFISLYIILIITLGMFVISSRNGSQVFTTPSAACTLHTTSSSTGSNKMGSSSSTTLVKDSHDSTTTSASSTGASGDDNWKLGLYTNRTLGRDYDPLLVVVYDTLKTSVNYSSRLFKATSSASLSITTTSYNGEVVTSSSTAPDDLLFNSCSGTTLRHYCRIKTSQLLQDLTFMAHMSKFQNLGQHATAHHIKSSLNPQIKHLIALAVYGDETVDITDFWESLSLLDILLSDIYDYIPDKNR